MVRDREARPAARPPARPGPGAARFVLPVIGALLCLAGLDATVAGFGAPLNDYDEGLILTNANLILAGAAPVRDFYSNYAPGIFLVVAGTWKLLGASIGLERLLGIAIHLALATLAGRIAGRIAGCRFSLLAAGLVLLWISPLQAVPFAWMAALAVACAGIELALAARERAGPWVIVLWGFSLGALGGLRQDLFVYVCLVLAGIAIGLKIARRPTPLDALGARAGWALAGFAIPAVLVWGPTIARAGWGPVARDLYFDQVHYVLPARALPLPVLLGGLTDWYPGAAALALLGAPLALWGLARATSWGVRDPAALILTGALAIAVLPQLLGRSDQEHCVYAVAPALTIAAALIEARAGRPHPTWLRMGPLLAAALALWFPTRSLAPSWESLRRLSYPGFSDHLASLSAGDFAGREQVLALIARNTQPGEGIFVGNDQHQMVTWNDVSLYYLANRPGVTRYLQFDPGIVTRADVQQQMVRDLDRHRTRIAVLVQGGYRPEANRSAQPGSDVLDEYLRRNFHVLAESGPYTVLGRSVTAGP